MRRSKNSSLVVALVFCTVAGLTATAASQPLAAATLQGIILPALTVARGTCAGSAITAEANLTAPVDDAGGLDYFAFVTYQGNGAPISVTYDSNASTSSFTVENIAYNGLEALGTHNHLVDLTTAPVIMKVFDVTVPASGTFADQIATAEASPLLGQATFDPRTDPKLSRVCANLPYATVSVPALSPAGLAALIGLLALGAVALLRRRV